MPFGQRMNAQTDKFAQIQHGAVHILPSSFVAVPSFPSHAYASMQAGLPAVVYVCPLCTAVCLMTCSCCLVPVDLSVLCFFYLFHCPKRILSHSRQFDVRCLFQATIDVHKCTCTICTGAWSTTPTRLVGLCRASTHKFDYQQIVVKCNATQGRWPSGSACALPNAQETHRKACRQCRLFFMCNPDRRDHSDCWCMLNASTTIPDVQLRWACFPLPPFSTFSLSILFNPRRDYFPTLSISSLSPFSDCFYPPRVHHTPTPYALHRLSHPSVSHLHLFRLNVHLPILQSSHITLTIPSRDIQYSFVAWLNRRHSFSPAPLSSLELSHPFPRCNSLLTPLFRFPSHTPR